MTTRTVLLLRHGKSRWDEEGVADHDRGLTGRGKRDAENMGRALCAHGILPDLILSSTAKRARSTAKRAIRTSGYTGDVIYSAELYFRGLPPYLAALSALPDAVHTVLLVGHNPLLEELLQLLTGEFRRLPTAALAAVDLEVDSWAQVDGDTRGTLRLLLHAEEADAKAPES